MNGFISTSLQLQSIIIAHNPQLPKTPSFPYWTTGIFSSTVTNDERRITATESSNSLTNQLINQFTNELSFITWGELTRNHHLEQFVLSRVLLCYYSLPQKRALVSRWPATDYSGYSLQRECAHQAVAQQRTSSLAPLFRLSCVMSQYFIFASSLCYIISLLDYILPFSIKLLNMYIIQVRKVHLILIMPAVIQIRALCLLVCSLKT
jgi:hypothetical protein